MLLDGTKPSKKVWKNCSLLEGLVCEIEERVRSGGKCCCFVVVFVVVVVVVVVVVFTAAGAAAAAADDGGGGDYTMTTATTKMTRGCGQDKGTYRCGI